MVRLPQSLSLMMHINSLLKKVEEEEDKIDNKTVEEFYNSGYKQT